MVRALIFACVFFLSAPCFAVTLQFGCVFSNQITPPGFTPYSNPNLCANQVTVNPDNAKTTTDDKYWSATGPNGCTYLVTAKKLTSGGYSWFVAVVDTYGKCVVQAGGFNVSNTTCNGVVFSSTAKSIALMAAADGTFTVGP